MLPNLKKLRAEYGISQSRRFRTLSASQRRCIDVVLDTLLEH